MRSGGSRLLVLALLLAAAAAAIVPALISRGRGVAVMRREIIAVLGECRARYGEARTAADTVRADAWVPHASTGPRPDDPSCGRYRRRNMLAAGA